MRKGTIHRVSKETQIQLSLTIEGRGRYEVSTGIGWSCLPIMADSI